ncbi:MAG: hypothetical protein ACRDLM_00455 [Gaiellaceae bacterium]
MSDENDAYASAEDVQVLENVLNDTPTSPRSRAWLLKRAALGVGVAAAATPIGQVLASSGADTAQSVGTTAVTAEALAVTYLTEMIGRLGSKLGAAELPLKAANRSEQDHYAFLSGAGFKPQTTKFWIPDAAFQAKNVAPTIEALETIFVNAYLIGTTVFAKAKNAKLARYTAEIAGVEAEHRTLARQLQGKLPDNLAYEIYKVKTMSGAVSEIESAGIGFGKQGSKPGAFYTYKGTTPATVVALDNNAPDQTVPFPFPHLSEVKGAQHTNGMPKGNPVMTG